MKVLKSISVVLLVLMVLSMFVCLIVSTTGVAEPKRELEVYGVFGQSGNNDEVKKIDNGAVVPDFLNGLIFSGNYMKKDKEYSFIIDINLIFSSNFVSSEGFSSDIIVTSGYKSYGLTDNVVIDNVSLSENCISVEKLPDNKYKVIINKVMLNYPKNSYPGNYFDFAIVGKANTNSTTKNLSIVLLNDIQLKK